jgi:hypothetical protein
VSQGGVAGYFLGYWSSLTATPSTTIGATGFIKLREVTGGTFSAGALSGITATAAGADVVGWIEVVHDQAIAITVPRLGDFTVRGDWFVLGTTSGSANQLIQVPTNGSSTTYVPGVWIATTASPVTDDDWEFYPSIYAGGMSTTNLGTDTRSKFVCMETNGNIRIGHNGTTTVGYVPPSGRLIRIPNVLGRQCTTAARGTNAIPSATAGTRPDFTTTSAGYIDVENFATDWYLLFAQAFYVKLNHTATFDYINISECASALDIYDGGNGISQSLDARTVTLTSNFAGGRVEKWKSHRYSAGTTDHAFEVLYCIGQTITNCDSGIVTFARSTGVAYQITQSSDMIFNNCRQYNQAINFTTCFDCTVNDHDHSDRYVGATTTTGVYAVVIAASSENIVIDGFTFGLGCSITNVHPYTGLLSVTLSKNCKFRNIGTRAIPLAGGSANAMGYIFVSGGNNQNLKLQRIYVWPSRTGAISTVNSDKNMLYEHVYGDMGDTMTVANLNSVIKNCGGTNTTSGQTSVYGTHFWDAFTSDTAGRVILSMNEPTIETSSLVSYVAGSPQFTAAGNLYMPTQSDEVIIEQSYFVLGCTALTNTAPVLTGTNVTYSAGPAWGNHNIYYQINPGTGYGGTWKDLTAANLSSETVSPVTGFKLKYRIVCNTTSTTNLLTYIRISTTSSLTAQSDNMYPLDLSTVTIDNPVLGSAYEIYNLDNSTQLATGTISTNPQIISVIASATQTLRVRLRRSKGILLYDAQTANFGVGNMLAGSTSGATAVIGADNDSGTSGSLTLENIVGVFLDNEIITDDGGGSATANGSVGGKYLPYETNAVVPSSLSVSVYASQIVDTIAV